MLAMLGYDEDTKEDKSGFKLVSSNFNAWYAPVRSCKGDVNRVDKSAKHKTGKGRA